MKIAVYTANIGNNIKKINDSSHDYEHGIDYIYFTDNKNIKSKMWNVVYLENLFENTKISPGNRILAKKVKMIFWKYFKKCDYDWIIWVDAHHALKKNETEISLKKYISEIPNKVDIVFKKHTGFMHSFDSDGNMTNGGLVRKYDLYDEITHIKNHQTAKLENFDELEKWETQLKHENYPKKSGLIETNKIIWRFNYNHISRMFNEEWFDFSTNRFRRDQLTLNYLIWKDENIKKHVKVDYLDDVIKTEQLEQAEKSENGIKEWCGEWDVTRTKKTTHPVIYTHIPYNSKACANNLGCAYNKFMEQLKYDDDWVCFIDHDAMFTTDDWYQQISKIIRIHKNVGAFGVRANRVGYRWQMVKNIDIDSNDINYHRKIGKYLQKKYFRSVSTGQLIDEHGAHRPCKFSGVVILIQKKIWKKIGGFKTTGFTGVDDDLRVRLFKHKIPFAIMDGVYVYHWYRQNSPYASSAETLNKIRKEYKHFISNNKFSLNKITLYMDRR
jgi:hypothetical protein